MYVNVGDFAIAVIQNTTDLIWSGLVPMAKNFYDGRI